MSKFIFMALMVFSQFSYAGRLIARDIEFKENPTGAAPTIEKGLQTFPLISFCVNTQTGKIWGYSKPVVCENLSESELHKAQFTNSKNMGFGGHDDTYYLTSPNGMVLTGNPLRITRADLMRISQIAGNVTTERPMHIVFNDDFEIVQIIQ